MRPGLSGFNAWTYARADLQEEGIAVGRRTALQPEHPRVQVPHGEMSMTDVSPEPAVRTLRYAAIVAEARKAGQEETEVEIEPAPGRVEGRLVRRGEQDGVRLAAARAAGRHAEWHVVDLQAQGTGLLGIAPEPHAQRRTTRLEGSAQRDEESDGGAEGAGEQLRLTRAAERERHTRTALQRMNLAVRYLEKAPFDECRGLRAQVQSNPESKAKPDFATRLRRGADPQEPDVLIRHAGESDRGRREWRDALRSDGIVVRLDAEEGHVADAAVVREVAITRDRGADLSVVAGE